MDYRIEANGTQIGSSHNRDSAIVIAKHAARRRYRQKLTGTVYVIEYDPKRDEEEEGVKSVWDSRCMTEDNLRQVIDGRTGSLVAGPPRTEVLDDGRGPKQS